MGKEDSTIPAENRVDGNTPQQLPLPTQDSTSRDQTKASGPAMLSTLASPRSRHAADTRIESVDLRAGDGQPPVATSGAGVVMPDAQHPRPSRDQHDHVASVHLATPVIPAHQSQVRTDVVLDGGEHQPQTASDQRHVAVAAAQADLTRQQNRNTQANHETEPMEDVEHTTSAIRNHGQPTMNGEQSETSQPIADSEASQGTEQGTTRKKTPRRRYRGWAYAALDDNGDIKKDGHGNYLEVYDSDPDIPVDESERPAKKQKRSQSSAENTPGKLKRVQVRPTPTTDKLEKRHGLAKPEVQQSFDNFSTPEPDPRRSKRKSEKGPHGRGGERLEAGSDPNADPDLALGLRLSLEEERRRQQREEREQAAPEASRLETLPEEREQAAAEVPRLARVPEEREQPAAVALSVETLPEEREQPAAVAVRVETLPEEREQPAAVAVSVETLPEERGQPNAEAPRVETLPEEGARAKTAATDRSPAQEVDTEQLQTDQTHAEQVVANHLETDQVQTGQIQIVRAGTDPVQIDLAQRNQTRSDLLQKKKEQQQEIARLSGLLQAIETNQIAGGRIEDCSAAGALTSGSRTNGPLTDKTRTAAVQTEPFQADHAPPIEVVTVGTQTDQILPDQPQTDENQTGQPPTTEAILSSVKSHARGLREALDLLGHSAFDQQFTAEESQNGRAVGIDARVGVMNDLAIWMRNNANKPMSLEQLDAVEDAAFIVQLAARDAKAVAREATKKRKQSDRSSDRSLML